MSLTREMREELARRAAPPGAAGRAELAATLRYGGAWVRRGAAAPAWELESRVAAVVRRTRAALASDAGARTTLSVHHAGGLSADVRYRLRVEGSAALAALGLIDAAGAPLPGGVAAPPRTVALGMLRGALMAAGSLSAAGRRPHLEIGAPGPVAAEDLLGALAVCDVPGAGASVHGEGYRVVLKSGARIADLLAITGAHGTFLAFDDGRLRRQLRGEATRAANADRANVGRAVAASARDVAAIERLLGEVGSEGLPEPLREVALARLANPGASLADLAALLAMPKATLHRRLARLTALLDSSPGDGMAEG